MGIRENISTEVNNLNSYMSYLRDKLWREDKLRINGYTFSEWKEEQERRIK